MATQASARSGIVSLPVAAILLSAMSAAPAMAQSLEEFDIEHVVTPTFQTDSLSAKVNWLRRVRAGARVGRFCGDTDGFTLLPKALDVASGVVLQKQVYVEAGANDYTTALAEARAQWDKLVTGTATQFTLHVRSFGSSNPVRDRCIGKKLRSARAKSWAKSKLFLHVKGDPDGTNEVQRIEASGTGTVSGGTFTITFDGQTTAPIDWNAPGFGGAGSVEGALHALSTIGLNNVEVTGLAGGPWRVEFVNDLKSKDVGLMTVDSSLLTGTGGTFSYVAVDVTKGGITHEKAGAKGFTGKWVNKQGGTIWNPKTREKKLRDPVVARVLDVSDPGNPVVLNEWTMIDVKSSVGGNGQTSMSHDGPDFVRIVNDAKDMELRIEVGSSIVDPSDWGLIHVKVENGKVTQRTLSGPRFASVSGIPALGAPGTTWSTMLNMNHINYVIPLPVGIPTEIEFELGGGGHGDSEVGLISSGCSLLTDIGDGADGTDVSVIRPGDTAYGFSAQSGIQSVMERLTTSKDTQLDFMVVPYFIEGAPSMTAPAAAYVQVWFEDPRTGGTVMYGDLVTPQSMVVEEPLELYRVDAGDKKNTSREILEAVIDLEWVPTIPKGTLLGIEVMFDGAPGFVDISVPQSPFADASTDSALGCSLATGTWSLLTDPGSGRTVCLPIDVFGSDPEVGCAADCNGDGVLDIQDFICFQNAFAMGDPVYADCDANGVLNVLDFVCFQNAFAVGCP